MPDVESRFWLTKKNKQTGGFLDFFCMYFIQHCFIRRPSDFTVSDDARIEPRTVATSALAVRCSNQPLGQISSTLGQISSTLGYRSHPCSARSHPHSARSHPCSAIDLIHARLDLTHARLIILQILLSKHRNFGVQTMEKTDGGKTESGQKMSSTGTNAPNFLSTAAQCLFTCSSPCFCL